MAQPLDQGYHADDETDQKNITGHIFLGVQERVVGIQYQLLHATKNVKSEDAGAHRRDDPTGDDRPHLAPYHGVGGNSNDGETDDRADDGVCG